MQTSNDTRAWLGLAAGIFATGMVWSFSPASHSAPTPDFDDPKTVNAEWMVHYMGRGTNLGNTYEMNLQAKDYASVKRVIDTYIAAGFTNIRIPINWGGRDNQYEGRADIYGNVDFGNQDLKTIERLLDYVLYDVNDAREQRGQKPIILIANTHHEDWAMQSLIGSAQYERNMQRMENIWKEMAFFFADYPDTLVLELFNEPHGPMNSGDAARRSVVDFTKRFYKVIRNYSAGGYKPHQYRKIIFGGYNYNSSWGLWDTFRTAADLPGGGNDDYVIGTFHFYNNINDANNSFNQLESNFENKYGIPVHMGEFGVDHRGNVSATVREYYRRMASEAIKRGMTFSVWDDNGWFQMLNRGNNTWNALKNEVIGDGSVPPAPSTVPDGSGGGSGGGDSGGGTGGGGSDGGTGGSTVDAKVWETYSSDPQGDVRDVRAYNGGVRFYTDGTEAAWEGQYYGLVDTKAGQAYTLACDVATTGTNATTVGMYMEEDVSWTPIAEKECAVAGTGTTRCSISGTVPAGADDNDNKFGIRLAPYGENAGWDFTVSNCKITLTNGAGSAATNLLSSDGTLSSGQEDFGLYLPNGDTATWNAGTVLFDIGATRAYPWNVQLTHPVALVAGETYSICVAAKATGNRIITIDLDSGAPSFTTLSGGWKTLNLTTADTVFKTTVVASGTDTTSRLAINMGQAANDVTLNSVGVFKGSACGAY